MIRETDIPCTNCGDELAERTVSASELAVRTTHRGPVEVAECPCCGARYYPERTLAALAGGADGWRSDGTAVRNR